MPKLTDEQRNYIETNGTGSPEADRAIDAALARIDELEAFIVGSKRSHFNCDDPWYSCPLSSEGCADDSKVGCDCGADRWNSKIDALMAKTDPGA